MDILVVGGDSAATSRQRAAGRVEHWSGRRPRDLARAIPKRTEAVVVILDWVSHALVKKVQAAATRRGLSVLFQKRSRRIDAAVRHPPDTLDLFLQ